MFFTGESKIGKKIFTGRPKAIRDVYIYFKKQTLQNDVRTTYNESMRWI